MKHIVAPVVLDPLDGVIRRGRLEKRRWRHRNAAGRGRGLRARRRMRARASREVILGLKVERFARVAVGDDQHIAMEMHRPLWPRRSCRGKAKRDIVAAGGSGKLHSASSVRRDRVPRRDWRCRLSYDDLLEETAVLGTGDQFRPSGGNRTRPWLISALSTILASSPARSIGMVLTTTAPALVAAEPASHHRRDCWQSGSTPDCPA